MSTQKAKAYLSRYRRSLRRIDDLQQQVMMLDAQATKVTAALNDIGGGRANRTDGFETTLTRLIDKKNELVQRMQQLLDVEQEVEDAIARVRDEDQRDVLFKRYVLCQRFADIADDLNITERQAYHLHGLGLLDVDKRLEG